MSLVPFSVYEHLSKEELLLERKQQFDNWKNFFFEPSENELGLANQARDPILESWARCREYKDINPMIEGSVRNLSDDEIKELRQQSEIFQMAQPIISYFQIML